MNRTVASWLIALIRPPLVALRFIFGPACSVVLGALDRRVARRHEEHLAQDVRDALAFAFADNGGRIVPNEGVAFSPAFDYAFITVSLDGVLFRFSRGRGELAVCVAPASAPSDWHELSLVLAVINGEADLERSEFRDLWDVARVLQPRLTALLAAFAGGRFEDLKKRLNDEVYSRDRTAIRQWQAEINRHLYPGAGGPPATF